MKRGLTVLEILVATGIVAAGILALIGLFTQGLRAVRQAGDLTQATHVGREVLEAIRQGQRLHGFAFIPAGSYQFAGGPPAGAFPPPPYPERTVQGRHYQIRVSGQQLSATLKSVVVEVAWSESQKIRLETCYHP